MVYQFSALSLSPLLNFGSDPANFLIDGADACLYPFNSEFTRVKNALSAMPMPLVIFHPLVSLLHVSAETTVLLETNVTLNFLRDPVLI
jgi:hypothetical protein